jgi:hypothetical protein
MIHGRFDEIPPSGFLELGLNQAKRTIVNAALLLLVGNFIGFFISRYILNPNYSRARCMGGIVAGKDAA